jgi:hypothetical protein
MSDLPQQISLKAGGVNRDYYTIFKDLESLIPHFTKEWTYHGEDDFGITLLQLFSYLADHLHYRADTVFRDSRAATTQDRHILEKLSEWLGYFALRANPAACEVRFTLDRVLAQDYTIPGGTQVKAAVSGLELNDSQDILFELKNEVVIPFGGTSALGTVYEGESRAINLGAAVGDRFETFLLPDTNIIFNRAEDDFEVRVNGQLASFEPFFAMAVPDQLSYSVNVVRGGLLQVVFGDGSFGRRLAPGDIVTVVYRMGGGTVGLVGIGAITTIVGDFTAGGEPLTISVTNSNRSFGGASAETDANIRLRAPAYFATQNRAVTLNDYKIRAELVAGVNKCQPIRVAVNGILLHVLPDEASEDFVLTDAFVTSILRALEDYSMATDVLSVVAANLVPIEVELECFAFQSQQNSVVRRKVLEAFIAEEGILHLSSNAMEQHLRLSDMINIIEDVEGLDYLNVKKYTRRPALEWISRSGGADLHAGLGVQINRNTIAETYRITFTEPDKFLVSGSITGNQTQELGGVGTLGVPYTVRNPTPNKEALIQFQINAGNLLMQPGDRGRIIVTELASNIQLLEGEFPVAGVLQLTVTGGIE